MYTKTTDNKFDKRSRAHIFKHVSFCVIFILPYLFIFSEDTHIMFLV